MSDYVRTVCVPGADMVDEFPTGTLTTITGWGEKQNGKSTQTQLVPIKTLQSLHAKCWVKI